MQIASKLICNAKKFRLQLIWLLRSVFVLSDVEAAELSSESFSEDIRAQDWIDHGHSQKAIVHNPEISTARAYAVLCQAHLVPPRACILVRSRRIFAAHLGGRDSIIRSHISTISVFKSAVNSFRKPCMIKGEVLSVNSPFLFNYYHWILDCLQLIYDYENIKRTRPLLQLLIPDNLAPFQERSLELLGYSHTDSPAIRSNDLHYLAERLVVPIPSPRRGECRIPSPGFIHWLNYRTGNRSLNALRRQSCIYVSRKDSAKRRISNEAQVEELFKSIGFQVITLSSLSLDEQISAFSSARIVAGIHGAGLSNVVFSKRHTCVIEILPDLSLDWQHFRLICRVQHLQYFPACCLHHEGKSGLPRIELENLEALVSRVLAAQ